MPEVLNIDAFLVRHAAGAPVVDVRTPSEFARGHLTGAVNLPLFSNDERAEIGTLYKQVGRREAVRTGLDRVGPRLGELADALLKEADGESRELLVHCWRGGMRSESAAWLAEMAGCRTATLRGGYKAFRRWVLDSFAIKRDIRVVAGLTGTGKTEVIRALAVLGENAIDLEGIANHKGSVFGDLGEESQPTQIQFENDLALAWRATDPARPVWVEDESRMIGRMVLPAEFWEWKTQGRYSVIELPVEARVAHLRSVYADYPADALIERIERIRRRLGNVRTRQAIEAIEAGDLGGACLAVLSYYDRTYGKCLAAAEPACVERIPFNALDPAAIAARLAGR